jgi:hypothetical protein
LNNKYRKDNGTGLSINCGDHKVQQKDTHWTGTRWRGRQRRRNGNCKWLETVGKRHKDWPEMEPNGRVS